MNIQGIQKLTLLDYPGKVACTVFTGGCNFRCPFCHNALLVTETGQEVPYSEEEIFAFLKKRQGILDGICISGGEPCIQKDLTQFIEKVKKLGYLVKLDTNGSFPKCLKMLVEDKLLDYVAMDIKNAPKLYDRTAGISKQEETLKKIRESAAFLMENHVPYEFRTTVVKGFHSEETFEEIAKWIRGAERYFLQAFVDSGELLDSTVKGCTQEEMRRFLAVVKQYVPNAELRGI